MFKIIKKLFARKLHTLIILLEIFRLYSSSLYIPNTDLNSFDKSVDELKPVFLIELF